MEEIWRDIRDYEWLYQVSNLGRVKSLDRLVVFKNKTRNGRILFKKGKIMTPVKYPKSNDPNDYYLGIMLCKEGKEKIFRVNRLVAEAFIPNPRNLPTVNHLNKIKWDNRAVNLEWSDVREQRTHSLLGKNKSSKYTGVSWHKWNKNWIAQIQIDGKKIPLGSFKKEEDARDA